MTRRPPQSELKPDELERIIIKHGRAERPSAASRERTLKAVTAVTGTGLLSSVTVARAATLAGKNVSWLALKSAAIGLSVTVVAINATQLHPSSHGAAPSAPRASVRPDERRPRAVTTSIGPSAPVVPPSASVGHDSESPVRDPAPATFSQPSSASRRPTRAAHLRVGEEDKDKRADHVEAHSAQLTREVALLQLARAALNRQRATAAASHLDQYDREFPSGSLRTEAAALRVETLVANGERERASRAAEAFLREHPASPLANRVRASMSAAAGPSSYIRDLATGQQPPGK